MSMGPDEAGGHILTIDHVHLAMPAGAEDVGRRFYGDVLGLVEQLKPAGLAGRGGCWFASADGSVAVHLGGRRLPPCSQGASRVRRGRISMPCVGA